MTLPVTITFVGANGTALETQDANWVELTGAASFEIRTNGISPNKAGADQLAYWNGDVAGNDQSGVMTLGTMGVGIYIGIALRVQTGAVSGYAFGVSTNDSYFGKYVAGVFTQIGSLGVGYTSGDTATFEIAGTTLTVKKNGVLETTIGTGGHGTDATFSTGRFGVTGFDNQDAVYATQVVFSNIVGAASLSAVTPSGTLGTTTTVSVGATTDQVSGTFYGVVDSAANLSGVTGTQVKAGQKASGAAAAFSGNSAVSTTTPSVPLTGLTPATAYSYAVIQNNTNGDSNLLTGTFTTATTVPNPNVRTFGAQGFLRTLLNL